MSTPAFPAAQQPPAKPPVTHKTIDATGCGLAIKAALHRVLDGMPFRDAAREVGLASHQDVHRYAKRLGLLEVHTTRLVQGCKRIMELSNTELEHRLVDAPESIATRDLSVLSGIMGDKIARLEPVNHDAWTGAAEAVDRLSQLEGKLRITIERTPERPTIDVSKTGG